MKIEIKNKELAPLINMINGFQTEVIKCKGLRFENISMGVKVRLSKIEKELVKHLTEFDDVKKAKISEVYPSGITPEIENKAILEQDEVYFKLVKEINECSDETLTIEFDSISLSKVEDVTSDYDYSFLLEKIAE